VTLWRMRPRALALSVVALVLAQCGPDECAPAGESQPVVYLTFDDGPSGYTGSMLDVLGRHGVRGTFFVLGTHVGGRPSTVAAIRDAGHAVGNHTWSHRALTELSDAAVRNEILSTDQVIADVTGWGSGCVRPPMGAVSDRVRSIVRSLGMTTVMWTIDTRDWTDGASVGSIIGHLNDAVDGSIVLLHDGGGNQSATVAAVDQWLGANADRYRFAVLGSC
jgi:peptidoglycan-N-acetylglucosamine deacetylase